ncbi:MAG: peptide chain release factor 2 [bacterium]|nr:peptide chain release factor 2 [bacterium]
MGGHFDLDAKQTKINEIKEELNSPDIWSDITKSNELNSTLINLQKEVGSYKNLVNELDDNIELINLMTEEELKEINTEKIKREIEELEINTLFTEKYDNLNCFLEIHPGAGGTESQDWASMLLRMYKMFCDKYGYTYEEIDYQKGEEAGIKNATLKISGHYAYGYFKSEQGVHRLVRISPFDSNKRRHTSFASVSIIPEISQTKDVTINPDDIRVDVYRSSGKGGQGVNTTDSAVRITHYPSGIVVTCQNERSQIKNKEIALNILKSKLQKILDENNEKDINNLKNHINIDFGSQIRNYVLEPYKLVKDLRTGEETSNADAVLNGEIKNFMESYLRIKR